VGYPATKFANAPFEIIDGDRGKAYPKQGEFRDSGHCLFLSATNVTKSGFDFASGQFIDERKDAQLRKGKLQREDVVLTTRGTLGNVAYYDERVPFEHLRINSGMVILRCDRSKILPAFLYAFLRSNAFKAQVERMRSGVAQPQLPIRDMKRIEMPLPPPRQQEGVIEAISPYDDLIENNRRRIALLEEAARMLYREWFVHFRFPGHEHVKIIDGLPEGWEAQSASVGFDVNPSTPRNGDEEILCVPMAALSETGMTVDRSSFELRTKSTNVRFRNADTLFARITPCLENGKTGFVYFLQDNEVACGSTEFIVLRGRTVSPYFVYLTSRMDSFRQNAIKSMIGSSGRQRVQDSCFDRYRLAIPPKLLATVFDETVGPMFDQIGNLDQANRKLAQARDLLLPRLMNGEITV
jgi:type I restriction enzyme, S subunit